MDMTRRRTIAGFVALPALPVATVTLAQAAPAASRLASFRALSARLTGFDVDRINADRALGIVQALLAAGDGAALDRLLAGEDEEGDRELAMRIAQAWYLGELSSPGWPASRLFHEALVWQALEFTQPPGFCARKPEAWHQPPSANSTT